MAPVEGQAYIFTNEAMHGLVKIAYTMKDPSIRAEDLFKKTSIPMPSVVAYKALVVNSYGVE